MDLKRLKILSVASQQYRVEGTVHVLLDVLVTVKAASHECVFRNCQP